MRKTGDLEIMDGPGEKNIREKWTVDELKTLNYLVNKYFCHFDGWRNAFSTCNCEIDSSEWFFRYPAASTHKLKVVFHWSVGILRGLMRGITNPNLDPLFREYIRPVNEV